MSDLTDDEWWMNYDSGVPSEPLIEIDGNLYVKNSSAHKDAISNMKEREYASSLTPEEIAEIRSNIMNKEKRDE